MHQNLRNWPKPKVTNPKAPNGAPNGALRKLLFSQCFNTTSKLHLNKTCFNNDTAMTSFNYYNAMASSAWDFKYI